MFCKECGSEIIDEKFFIESDTPINAVQNISKEKKDEFSNLDIINF